MLAYRSLFAAAMLSVAALLASTQEAQAGRVCCVPCCPPPPIYTTLCVQPPCSCCQTVVEVCLPACCTEAPTVCWRSGLLGRQIGTYTWPCCGHSVEVVVTRRGDVRVR